MKLTSTFILSSMTHHVAIVTGGSKGFGRAVAADLVADGLEVVLDARDARALEAAARELGPRAHPVPGDVTDAAHRAALIGAATSLGELVALVNNASDLGPTPLPPLRDVAGPRLARLFATNVLAPLELCRLALPSLAASHGAIVNVTSDAAVEAYAGWGAYGATKAALEQVSHVLSVEEPDVRVWWLDPGDMRTDMHQAAFPDEDISDRPPPEDAAPVVRRLLATRPPSGRIQAATLLEGAR
jgi:NAD(P)-dependent dehydrogenase (short-subunit alcohol dehydrogenase family)